MDVRVTNPALRWFLLAGVAMSSGALGYAGARHAIAQHWAASPNSDQWEHAAEQEPLNAENWYRLGRYRQFDFEHADLPLAIGYYRKATALNPVSALYWMDLAGAYETVGNFGQAEQAYHTAQQVYPMSGEVAWRFGNFLLRQDRTEEAFRQIRRAVSADPKLTMLAISSCWRSTHDIDEILKFALPSQPETYWDAIGFFAKANDPDAAMTVWKQLIAGRTGFPVTRAFPLIDFLIQLGRADEAKMVWQQALSRAGVEPEVDTQESLIWDGGFERELLNGGFAWRYMPVDGASINFDEDTAHSGKRSLRVVFDGSTNLDFGHIWQWVAVEPNTHYRFNAYIKSEEVTTDSGIRFQIENGRGPAILTPSIVGTQAWALDDMDVTAGPDTHLLRIVLRRIPSDRLGNKIRGTAWVDDVSLIPVATASPTSR
jgi:tetratricopeptide (TPR) repeat protein